ncbi:DNA double-strand break repair nuclease NurA [Helicobacter sp. MIT 05-5294]|uniref:DNA double-strand break repair nuclease NurA n=1 Tax=Helicobacter sp. MIT 05-5294 TaxID=1548150 RepID=UPI00051F90D0|nr:DNA double-strand break repair nuclease NurA [Helicobacter sp. MIT 05-5294]TLD86187.1 DNA double-strand break repair nuclease NurA [Helicobacter sp. MIT 05-5294]
MAYFNEKASKINHQYIIENPKVKAYLNKCEKIGQNLPLEVDSQAITLPIRNIQDKFSFCIERVITIDGGYQEVNINENFPSQRLCYYNIGILMFSVKDLEAVEIQQTINPSDIGKLENLERFNFVVPTQNIRLKNEDFITTFRKTFYEEVFTKNYLNEGNKNSSFIHTIKWLVFQEYLDSDSRGKGFVKFACPHCKKIQKFQRQTPNYLDEQNNFMECSECKSIIYITDCFDLHTLIDEINGATLIESYIMSAFEIILMFSMFRFLFEEDNIQWLPKILFIKDGPLALFSRLDDFAFKVVRPFIQFLYAKSLRDKISYVNLVGLDKSGMFVEHLKNIESKIPLGNILLPNLDYMKKYITGNNASVFGENTYFGIKMFVRKEKELSFVLDVAIPFDESVKYKDYIKQPKIEDFLSLKNILEILFQLKCDLYDKSFIPIAMVNKLVSLSNIPSKKILTIFSRDKLS